MKKLKKKKGKKDNNDVLEEFERLINRDKSNDIIRGNLNFNKKHFESMFIDMFYDKLREFFSNYLDKEMGKENIMDDK